MPEITMPRLSDSMEEGTILKWLKSNGDEVTAGDELAEIETDKATMTYEADSTGTLEILAEEGQTLAIGEIIARLLGPGEEPGAMGSPNGAQAERAAEPADKQAAARKPKPEAQDHDARVLASPVARRLARERGIDLSTLKGSGPRGRIVKADIEAAPSHSEEKAEPEAAAPADAAAERGTAKGDVVVEELSRLQGVVARRMAESKATVPDFVLRTDVDMEGCVALRRQLKDRLGPDAPVPSYNDMVVKACALALREFPRANGAYRDGSFELYSRVNVGVAVAGQDALVVPTVFDADTRSLGDIARATRELAAKVREGTVSPPELSGGTFTVSNLGMYGVTGFTAVINPPQAGILAVGAMAPVPVVVDGRVAVRQRMEISLTCDHRILYGADAAQFLARIRELLEEPLALML
jgi:pyruvate dehydrogenase E2 component (dihydrolipoamide acetyltransferase)